MYHRNSKALQYSYVHVVSNAFYMQYTCFSSTALFVSNLIINNVAVTPKSSVSCKYVEDFPCLTQSVYPY